MTQYTLSFEDNKMKSIEEVQHEVIRNQELIDDMKEYSEEYCIREISNSEHLWDLRCWHNDHDLSEVITLIAGYLKNKTGHINDGHALYCAGLLVKGYSLKIEQVAELFMNNRKVKNSNKLGSSYFCQNCGKSWRSASIIMVCDECLNHDNPIDSNRFNCLKNSIGEFGGVTKNNEDDENAVLT